MYRYTMIFVHTAMACDVNIVIKLWSVSSSMYNLSYTYHFQKKKDVNILLLFLEIADPYLSKLFVG